MLDVIIDDGSHQPEHQMLTASILRWHLAPGGVYVIEDVQKPEEVAAAVGGTIHKWDRSWDDCIVEVRK